MLAAQPPENGNFKFPLIASPKLDGIRCMVYEGVAMSRNWKPIPNAHVQKLIGRKEFHGLDGELGVGNPGSVDFYRNTMSGVMTEAGEPEFIFWVFDIFTLGSGFSERIDYLTSLMNHGQICYPANLVDQRLISSKEELDAYEAECLYQGYEGLIVRDPKAVYKHGRSTTKEGGMIKVKRFSDAEAIIVDIQELQSNNNTPIKNVFGRTERSSHKENLISMDTMGALICKTSEGIEFGIGTGFTETTRKIFWDNRKNLIGKYVKYKFFDGGNKQAPRFPVFLGFRDERDIS